MICSSDLVIHEHKTGRSSLFPVYRTIGVSSDALPCLASPKLRQQALVLMLSKHGHEDGGTAQPPEKHTSAIATTKT